MRKNKKSVDKQFKPLSHMGKSHNILKTQAMLNIFWGGDLFMYCI